MTTEQLPNIEYKWSRLLGVHTEYKALHPELALTLTIRDKLRDLSTLTSPNPDEDSQSVHVQSLETVEPLTQDISVVYLDEGFVQIGDGESNQDTFSLSFLIETAFNLDLLVPQKNTFREELDQEYFITLSCFDLKINTKKFKILHEPVILNDKIVFKLHSTIEYLDQFFKYSKVVNLKFFQGTEALGSADIHLMRIDLEQFFQEQSNSKTKYEEDCIFTICGTGEVPQGTNGRKPFVCTQTALVRNMSSNGFYTFQHGNGNGSQPVPVSDKVQVKRGYLDFMTLNERKDGSSQTSSRVARVARSAFTNFKDVNETNEMYQERGLQDNEEFRLYALTTTLVTIKWKTSHKDGFQFRFHHPKANTVLIVQCNCDQVVGNEPITLEDVKCTQYFVSTSNYVTTLVYTYPSKVTICNVENRNISEQFELYTKLFLTQSSKISEGIDACTCSYYAMISKENKFDDVLCELQIEMCLRDLGVQLENREKTCFDLEPIILDERVAFKTLSELKTWKDNQKRRYEERQKYLENEKIKLLNADWEVKRADLEIKLKTGIEKCRVLSEELVRASKDLENKKKVVEGQLKYKDNSEAIEMKVTQMMEKEMNMKLTQIRQENIQLLERIGNLTEENENLKESLSKKADQYEEFKRSTLTEEQTSGLLQELRTMEEKYRQEQNAKTFFKEQWQKAVREVHLLKSEDQRQIQQQIKKQKIELSQLSLQDFDKFSQSSGSTHSLISCPSGDCTGYYY